MFAVQKLVASRFSSETPVTSTKGGGATKKIDLFCCWNRIDFKFPKLKFDNTRNGPNHHPNFPFCRFPGFCWGSDDFFPPKSSCCARNIGKSQLQSTKPRRPVSLWHMHHVNHPGSRRFGGGMTQKVDGFSEPSPKQSMYGIPVPTCTIAKISQIWLVNIRTLHGWNWKKQILSKWESH